MSDYSKAQCLEAAKVLCQTEALYFALEDTTPDRFVILRLIVNESIPIPDNPIPLFVSLQGLKDHLDNLQLGKKWKIYSNPPEEVIDLLEKSDEHYCLDQCYWSVDVVTRGVTTRFAFQYGLEPNPLSVVQ